MSYEYNKATADKLDAIQRDIDEILPKVKQAMEYVKLVERFAAWIRKRHGGILCKEGVYFPCDDELTDIMDEAKRLWPESTPSPA